MGLDFPTTGFGSARTCIKLGSQAFNVCSSRPRGVVVYPQPYWGPYTSLKSHYQLLHDVFPKLSQMLHPIVWLRHCHYLMRFVDPSPVSCISAESTSV